MCTWQDKCLPIPKANRKRLGYTGLFPSLFFYLIKNNIEICVLFVCFIAVHTQAHSSVSLKNLRFVFKHLYFQPLEFRTQETDSVRQHEAAVRTWGKNTQCSARQGNISNRFFFVCILVFILFVCLFVYTSSTHAFIVDLECQLPVIVQPPPRVLEFWYSGHVLHGPALNGQGDSLWFLRGQRSRCSCLEKHYWQQWNK